MWDLKNGFESTTAENACPSAILCKNLGHLYFPYCECSYREESYGS